MAEDLEAARQCGREFSQVLGASFDKLSKALTFCDTDAERFAFLEGVIEGPPLTEEEEEAFGEWMDIWSPSDAYNMLPDLMTPREKRSNIKDMREREAEGDT